MTTAPWLRRAPAEKRFAKTAASPRSFDPATRTCEVVMSTGAAVDRGLYTEKLVITPSSVDLSRMKNGSSIAVLDSHNSGALSNIIGKLKSVRFQGSNIMLGVIEFAPTRSGDDAMQLVSAGMIPGCSIGYKPLAFRFEDADGNVLDPDRDRMPLDGSVTAYITRLQLYELSLVGIPADSDSVLRADGNDYSLAAVHRAALSRMSARVRMRARQRMIDCAHGR